MTEKNKVSYFQVAQGVWGMKLTFVNVYMVANRRGVAKGWVLVDTGTAGSEEKIIAMAEALFGAGTRPAAIVLTHGHPDHAGSLAALLKHWRVPVYAHSLEMPYLTGRASYPPPDPLVGKGIMSWLSPFFGTRPLKLKNRIREIDIAEGIPELPEWKVIETPGHSPGHVSLFLPLNTTLIAGDAFATTKPESAFYVLRNVKKLSGPPAYFTPDWPSAKASVQKLAALEPRIAAPGHGPVMRGRELQVALQDLADNFDTIAIPNSGRYVDNPAQFDENGLVYVPPFKASKGLFAAAVIAGFTTGLLIAAGLNKVRS